MPKKLTLDALQVESFPTTATPVGHGTVFGAETEAFISCVSDCGDACSGGCGTGGTGGPANTNTGCPQPSDQPCTWYAVFTCQTNQIAYPSQCTGCGVDCSPTNDYCPTVSPGWYC
jgi:hypothetical protein